MPYINQTDCFRRNILFLFFLGVWPAGTSYRAYKYYGKLIIFVLSIVYVSLTTINLYFVPKQLDSVVEELIFYFTALSTLSKVLTFLCMHSKIENILTTLQKDTFQPKTEHEYDIIDKGKKFIMKFYNIVAVVSLTSHLTHILSPLFAHIISSVPLFLPLCSYSFLSDEVKEKYIYPLYFYQCIGMHTIMWFNVNIDTFFLGLMILIIAQLDILDRRLRTVTDTAGLISESPRDKAEVLKLTESIKHFDELGKFCFQVQQVFGLTLFIQFGVASVIICVCLFRFILPAPFQYYIFLATYMFIMIIQILVPCWFGTRIIEKSNLLAHSVYDSDWTSKSRAFKTNMRLFVERTSRPLAIIGWKMFPLSLKTFTSIMNTAYSFFTLLRHMQSRL